MERERAARLRRATEPPWDELRAQRVLARVLAERQSERDTARDSDRRIDRDNDRSDESSKPRERRNRLVFMVIGVAAVIMLGVIGLAIHSATKGASNAANRSNPSTAGGARLTLIDGSVASLRADAQVRVDEQSPQHVELTQLGGQVHYDVTHDVARPFRVHVGNVVVSVHGTKFVVTATDDRVEVRVEQGVVGVEVGAGVWAGAGVGVGVGDGAGERSVNAGETLIVPAHLGVVSAPSSSLSVFDAPAPSASIATSGSAAANDLASGATSGAASDPTSAPAVDSTITAASLLASADAAREKGDVADAAVALRTLLARFPADARIPSAAFTLGKLERRLGRPAESARAFSRCRLAAPKGALAMDALAEEALAWSAAGQSKSAHDAAQRYLASSPGGAYAARMAALVSGAN